MIFTKILIVLTVCSMKTCDGASCQGRYFELSTTRASNYEAAKSACTSGGGVLTSIPDEETNNQLITQANGKVDNGWTGSPITAYTGGHKVGNQFQWQDRTVFASESGTTWRNTGYADWFTDNSHRTNTPSGGGNCMVFYGTYKSAGNYEWKWRDQPCNVQRYYICSKTGDRTLTLDETSYSAVSGQPFTIVISISRLYVQPLDLYYKLNDGSKTLITSGFTGTSYTHTLTSTSSSNSITISAESPATSCSIAATSQLQQVKTTLSRTSVVVSSSSSQTVTCTASGYSNAQARWIRGTTEVAASSTERIYQSVVGAQSTLYFKSNTVASDGGEYICRATNWNGGGNTDSTITLVVTTISSSSILVKSSSPRQSVTCTASGHSNPQMKWIRGSGEVTTSSSSNIYQTTNSGSQSTLYIQSTTVASDGGVYLCRATRLVGSGDTDKILTVNVAANIKTSPPSHVFAIGSSHTFTCTSYGFPTPTTLVWLSPVGSSSNIIQGSPTIRSSEHKIERTLTFTLKNISEAREYTCQVSSNVAGASTMTTNIQVQVAANISTSPTSHVATLQDKQIFTCTSFGYPLPQLTWLRNEASVSSSGNIYQAPQTSESPHKKVVRKLYVNLNQRSEAGQYTCKVSSNTQGGSDQTSNIEIIVAADINVAPTSRVAAFGVKRTFTCVSNGFPLPQVTWMRNGDEVSSSGNIKQTVTSSLSTANTATLHVTLQHISEAGEYTCTVLSNVHGGSNLTRTIQVQVAANISTSPTSHVFTSATQQTFTCTSYGYPTPQITWMRNGVIVSSSGNIYQAPKASTSTFGVVRNLLATLQHISEAGEYICKVQSNVDGGSDQTSNIKIQASANLTTSPAIHVFTLEQLNNFTCTFTGYPAYSIAWMRYGAQVSDSESQNIHQTSQKTTGTMFTRKLVVTLKHINEAGNYTCSTQDTSVQSILSSVVQVQVAANISTSPASHFFNYGEDKIFTCTSYGFPLPQITWYRGESTLRTLDSDDIYQQPQEANPAQNKVSRKLNATLGSIRETGPYSCKVSNNTNTGSDITTLINIQVATNISTSPKIHVLKIGSTQIFTCDTYGFPRKLQNWYRNGKKINAINIYQLQLERNYALQKYSRKLNVTLRHVNESGNYSCQVNSNLGNGLVLSENIQVQVLANISISKQKLLATKYNEMFTVECVSYGFPTPTLNWNRNGNSVPRSGTPLVHQTITNNEIWKVTSVLSFTFTHSSQAGDYICKASNVENVTAATEKLLVEALLNVSLSTRVTVIKDRFGTNVTCTSYGFPRPDIYWSRNGIKVSLNQTEKIHQTTPATTHISSSSTLVFMSASLNDSGLYVCHGNQTLSNTSMLQASDALQVNVGPIFKSSTAPTKFSQRQMFTCTFIGQPTPDVKWRINGQVIEETKDPIQISSNTIGNQIDSTLILQSALLFGPNSTIECWSENKIESSITNTVLFNTDLHEDSGRYYAPATNKKNYTGATVECLDRGGALPSLAFLNRSKIQEKWLGRFMEGVWVDGNSMTVSNAESSECNTLDENGRITNKTCEEMYWFYCIFAGIEIIKTSTCYHDKVVVEWRDRTRYSGTITYNISVSSLSISFYSSKQYTHESNSNFTYSMAIGNLQTDVDYSTEVKLFPDYSKILLPNKSSKTTSALAGMVSLAYQEQGMCRINATISEAASKVVTGLRVKTALIGPNGNKVNDTILDHTTSSSHVTYLRDGDFVNATYVVDTEECTNLIFNAVGNCSFEETDTGGNHGSPEARTDLVGAVLAPVVAVALLLLIAAIIYKRRNVSSWYVARRSTNNNRVRLRDRNQQHAKGPAGDKNPDPIAVEQLEDFFTNSFNKEHAGLTLQFNKIKETSKKFQDNIRQAKNDENAKKNRYKNILPYDANRVVLNAASEKSGGYINASVIEGYNQPRKWIATQGPTENTLDDFWSMIWGENVKVIVMLANLVEKQKSKCEKYWPDPGKNLEFGNIKVFFTDVTDYGSYIIRRFGVEDLSDNYTSERRELTQYHFTAWPDHGVPATSSGLIRLSMEVRNKLSSSSGAQSSPTVVHCSAGAGRTGTFIGLDYLIDQMNKTQTVDVYHVVYHMREQRMEMVQTVKQYIFLHKLLTEIAIFGNTDRSIEEFIPIVQESIDSPSNSAVVLEFANFHRFTNFEGVPPITIETTDTVTYHTSTVDIKWAYTIEGYHQRDHLIVCKDTGQGSDNFWKLVIERKPQLILLLQDPKYLSCWPNEVDQQTSFEQIEVTLTAVSEDRNKVSIESVYLEDKYEVEQLSFTSWNGNDTLTDASLLVELFQLIGSIRGGDKGDILILDNNGLARSGEFCAMWNLVSRFNAEKKIDVFRALRDVKETLPDLAVEVENYMDCYHAMKSYTDSCSVYTNS